MEKSFQQEGKKIACLIVAKFDLECRMKSSQIITDDLCLLLFLLAIIQRKSVATNINK
jgi:hypothetical protein